ncbi:FUSC family protein [Nocardioides sp. STR2]|uniref:FUSC family protein n=1 Tax=Nocardioides pini TaxID=2975053 RepID=A0ABT4CC01_9ACTN|nr:FUSC family protein [Nocardioides pini]MCY4726483.1 FUSC family protein [Nocardioides pini]
MKPHSSSGAAVRWQWNGALRGAVTAAPAAAVALWDVQAAAALAVGLLPVCSLPLAPGRPARLRSGLVGVLAALSVFLGGFLAQWPVVATLGLALAGGLLGHVVAARPGPVSMLGLVICLPLFAVGLSYPGAGEVAGLALDLLVGTAWSVLVALAWPEHPAPPAPRAPTPPPALLVTYGWVAGVTGAVCAAIGFAASLEHVGWAPAAALLVMRPDPPTQRLRSLDRLGDVVIGALAAIALVLADPPDWVYGAAILLVMTAATAVAGSRWYVLPTLTTCLVFIMLLARDPGDAAMRFWERVVETGLGVGIAAVAGFVVLPALVRRRASRPDRQART